MRLSSPAGAALGPLNFQAVLSERDNTIQFNYQQVTGPLLVDVEDDKRVGTFEKGQQSQSQIASDAAGNYTIVYTSPGQDTNGNGVFGRRYTSAGVPLGNEFQINAIVVGNQQTPRIAMAPTGEFVVVWNTDASEIFARIFDATGTPLAPEFIVSATTAGSQTAPTVLMNPDGSFVVAWNGNGVPDPDGIYARRFDAAGNPLGLVDEIQRIKILGPPQAPGPDTFTLNFGGQITGNIAFSNVNPLVTANNIQTQLRLLGNLSDFVTVTAVQQNEVQTVTFNPNPTGGNFTLVLGAVTTGSIDFTAAGPTGAARAAAMQAAIRAAAGR